MMRKASVVLGQTLLVPARISVRPEKVGAHVVIGAVHFPSSGCKVCDNLRTYEPGGACYKKGLHVASRFVMWVASLEPDSSL
jgi:hypothetical protein